MILQLFRQRVMYRAKELNKRRSELRIGPMWRNFQPHLNEHLLHRSFLCIQITSRFPCSGKRRSFRVCQPNEPITQCINSLSITSNTELLFPPIVSIQVKQRKTVLDLNIWDSRNEPIFDCHVIILSRNVRKKRDKLYSNTNRQYFHYVHIC